MVKRRLCDQKAVLMVDRGLAAFNRVAGRDHDYATLRATHPRQPLHHVECLQHAGVGVRREAGALVQHQLGQRGLRDTHGGGVDQHARLDGAGIRLEAPGIRHACAGDDLDAAPDGSSTSFMRSKAPPA